MKSVLRENILVDFGITINQLGAERIITPDKYKRIDNMGVIVQVADNCKLISKGDIGKKVIIGKWNRDDARFNPKQSVKLGLKAHWHFIVPESYVEALIE